MDLNETWQECCITSLDVHEGNHSCVTNFAGVIAYNCWEGVVLQTFSSRYIAGAMQIDCHWLFCEIGDDFHDFVHPNATNLQ